MKWRHALLGDICLRLSSGKNITASKIHDVGAYPVLGANGLRGFIDEANFCGKCNVIGRQGMACGNVRYFDGSAYMTDHALVAVYDDSVDTRYMAYYLARENLGKLSAQAAQPGVSVTVLSKYPIVLPPLSVQQKIADVLGAYDDLIENNRRRIELLEKMARELYRERFVRRREGVFETRTLEQIGVRLESGSRPKGGVKDLDEGIPSVGAENVIGLGKYNYGSEKLISEDFYTKMRRGKIQDRDILLYKDGAYIGRVSLFQDGFPHKVAAVNEHVFLLHAEDEVIQYFLFFTLAQDKYFKIMQGLNENAAQPGLNQGSVYGLKIDLPDFEQIKQFNDIVSPLVSEIFSLSNQNRNLAKQRDRLLPRLMSGKLDVSKLVKEGV